MTWKLSVFTVRVAPKRRFPYLVRVNRLHADLVVPASLIRMRHSIPSHPHVPSITTTSPTATAPAAFRALFVVRGLAFLCSRCPESSLAQLIAFIGRDSADSFIGVSYL